MAHIGPVAGRAADDVGKLQAWKGEENGSLRKMKWEEQMTRIWYCGKVPSMDDAKLDRWAEYGKPGDAIL
jgi:hypothetical protein